MYIYCIHIYIYIYIYVYRYYTYNKNSKSINNFKLETFLFKTGTYMLIDNNEFNAITKYEIDVQMYSSYVC